MDLSPGWKMRTAGAAGEGGRVMKLGTMTTKMGLMRTGVVLGCLVAIFLAGCATSRGFGQDVQSLGQGIENKAK